MWEKKNTFDTLEKQNTSPHFAKMVLCLDFLNLFFNECITASKCLQIPNYSTRC